MIDHSIQRLEYLCTIIPRLLSAMGEDVFSSKPTPGKWSRKEIIGHMIDSAANNHQRFVRGQFEDAPEIVYDPDLWNEAGYYQQINGSQIIEFWTSYNRQIVELVKRIPADKLSRTCTTDGAASHTLEFLFQDYVAHMEHHLHEVVTY